MGTKARKANHTPAACVLLSPGALLLAASIAQPVYAQRGNFQSDTSQAVVSSITPVPFDMPGKKETAKNEIKVPPGTIFPVRLNSSLSSSKSKANQVIRARIMQDVPLPGGAKITEGSQVLGTIVQVAAARSGSPAEISLRFDKLRTAHRSFPITTNLRAVAGFMEILNAQTPPIGPGESDVYRWLTTVQVGGDVVYGDGGIVTTGDDSSHVVGKSVGGGVLGQISAKEGTKCRGPLFGNDSPQALWVFSSDAC